MKCKLTGLVAATHTPFRADGSLATEVVERQAAHLLANRVATAFIGGTTGESSSLTLAERLALAEQWVNVARGTPLRVVVHVGANSVEDGKTLAAQAQKLGAAAVAAVAPSYFKPGSVAVLVETMAAIASAAPELPFYYYEIPSMTGLTVSPSEFLVRGAERIPNLAGMKFTSSNLMEYQLCRAACDGAFDVPFGYDEMMLSALAMGAEGAVGSTFNFAASIYHRLMAAFACSDFTTARQEQMRSVRMIRLLAERGFMGAAKATMEFLGVPVGPPRLPNVGLDAAGRQRLRADLEQLGFFDWLSIA